jgi:geranylgeranyl diphosphate synthase type I
MVTESMPTPRAETSTAADADAFHAYARGIKADVDARLASFLEQRVTWAATLGADVGVILDAYRALAVRGGKRLRAVLLAASYEACGGEGGGRAVTDAGVSLELLQAYLLVHDDWMDGDDTRRGGPSAHALLRERFGSNSEGDTGAILAGDYGAAIALEILAAMPVAAPRLLAAIRELARVQGDVVIGQIIDVRGAAQTRAQVEAMHRLKTASYTVRAPFLIGAALAGASSELTEGLSGAADPLGIAFQLRDDLLGSFGDPTLTGKSARGDLREGKRTAIIVELEGDREADRLLPRVLGVADAPQEEVDALLKRMVDSGAKARVEARLAALLDEARSRLARLPLSAEGKAVLLGAVSALGSRET